MFLELDDVLLLFQISQIIAQITFWVEPFLKKHDTQFEDARPSGIN